MPETSYTIYVEARAPDHAQPITDPEAVADQLMDAATSYYGSCTVSPTSWSVTFSLDADPHSNIAVAAQRVAAELATRADLPDWPIAQLEITRDDLAEEALDRPSMPDLVTGVRAAAMLGISRQRFHQLAVDHPEFPEPAFAHDRVYLYHRAAVERFSRVYQPRPGRPAKHRAESGLAA